MSASRKIAAAFCLALVACGGDRAPSAGFDGGTSSFALSLVGGANLVVHPGEKRTLQVLLTQDQVGPVANGKIHFEFQDGDPAGSNIDATDVQTDASGTAAVHFIAGHNVGSKPTFKVVASAPSYGSDPVAFSFSVIPVRRLLQIIGSASTRVASDGTTAVTTLGVSTSAALKVKELDADTGASIADDSILFTLPPVANSRWSGSTGRSITVPTGAGGEAQAFLLTTPAAEASFPVTVLSNGGGAAVTFNVTVQSGGGSSCSTNAQCGPGMVCIGNPPTCQPSGGNGGCGAGDNSCPFGYVCDPSGVCQPPSGNQCSPAAPNCTSGYCCASNNTCKPDCPSPCATGQHCVPGATCGTGSCVADASTPDVTGIWLTKHDYKIHDALPTAVRDLAEAFRLLDQAIRGKLTIPGLPGWLNAIINSIVSKLLQQYLPDWLQTVISIGDDLFTVLSNLRSAGSMHVVKNPDLTHLKGNEIWTSLIFYWLPLCGDNIGGDPGVPPPCAQIDIATTDADTPGAVGQCKGQSLPSITVQVAPFTASLTGSAAPYTLSVDERQVKLKMGKVILVLIDTIISLVTPYHCIDEIADCRPGAGNCPLVDCYGFGQDVENATGGLVPADLAEAACDGAVTGAGRLLTQLLATVWDPSVDTIDFKGRATVSAHADDSACDSGVAPGTCAGKLGNDNWDLDLAKNPGQRDGNWEGGFLFSVIKHVPGAWEATRPQ